MGYHMKTLIFLPILLLLFSCADGRVDVLDQEGRVVGHCSADFKFHLHGAQHPVNYILYLCAKEHIDNGFKISDESILANDYSIPRPPAGKEWSKSVAKDQFSMGHISEEKYGYILAHIEFEYWKNIKTAKDKLDRSVITEEQYESMVSRAKAKFNGT